MSSKGVVLNIDSPRALNRIVGHEITHVLEGTEAYGALREALYAYAESKGELASRKADLAELYNGINADIDAELTADLVGDYLFTDKDFINKLTGNRPLFQKVWDEVKYLCKVATGKELTEIEKVEREFAKAWKEQGQTAQSEESGKVKYSLNIKHTDGTIEKLANARDLTNEQAISYLNQAKSGKLKWNTYIPVRKDTPQVIIDTLKKAGESVDNRSLVMQVRKAQQAMAKQNKSGRKTAHGNNARGHALTPEEVVEIINNLDNPNTIILQTNRYNGEGKPLPNNVAVFVEYNSNGNEGMAVIEFESSIDDEFVGKEFGDTEFHTVVTLFEPDTVREGIPFDYAEELLLNPNNYELEIGKRQPTESAIGKKHPNTLSESPLSNDIVTQNPEKSRENTNFSVSVNENPTVDPDIRYSLSNEGEDIAPIGNYSTPLNETALEQDIAPVAENATALEQDIAPVAEGVAENATTTDDNVAPAEQTVDEKISSKLQNLQTELENNKKLRDESNADFDSEIARLQAEYDAKKNKNSKAANNILRRIKRMQRLKDISVMDISPLFILDYV